MKMAASIKMSLPLQCILLAMTLLDMTEAR